LKFRVSDGKGRVGAAGNPSAGRDTGAVGALLTAADEPYATGDTVMGLPVAGDGRVAAGTVPCSQIVFEDVVPGAADQEFVAVRAVRVGGVGVDVAFVDEVEAHFAGDLAGAMKSFGRSGRFVLELEVRVERSEMERNIGAEIGEDPVGELAGLGGVVVQGRNHEIGDFKPDASFLLEPFQGFENGREMGEGDFAVEIFGERF
jgi:hypothetical protein